MDGSTVATNRNPFANDARITGYGPIRRPDPRILRHIARAVGGAASVLTVGAGTQGYEPPDRRVVTVEACEDLIRRRSKDGAPVVKADVERLPFKTNSFAAALSVLTIQHWNDPPVGLRELARVASRRVVIVTMDPTVLKDFWLYRYFPDAAYWDSVRFPSLDTVTQELGGTTRVEPVPIPYDCRDGFLGAFWRRPSLYLEARIRRTIPTLHEIGDDTLLDGLRRLSQDLRTGAWDASYGWLHTQEELDIGYRLVVAEFTQTLD